MQQHVFGRAIGHHFAAAFTPLGAKVDQPVTGADHVEVVLDHHQRVARVHQLAQSTQQLGDVVKVQPGGGLVEHEQTAALRQGLAAGAVAARRLGQKTGQLEALRLAARERGHGLAELDVLQPDIDDGLQHAHHLAVVGKTLHRLAHREVKHVGHVHGHVAGDGDFQNLGPVALAVAIRAAQIDVAEELHLDMLEARAAAAWATPVATVEAELAGGVAALTRERRGGKQLANRVPGTDVAHRVGARRFANGRLVDKHHRAQLLGPEQAYVGTRRFGRLAKVAQQGRSEHVLHQRGLARARHAGDAHHALQRDFDRDVLEVVLGHAFKQQPWRVGRNHALEAHANLLAPAQVGTGEGVGTFERFGAAVKHDGAAALARARPHVEHAVGGEHHGRVVLYHHQGVAGIAQALHGDDDAVHVAWVQADAGFVEHKQGVDQRGAQRRGEVDALHFAATQGAALAVEREVANAHVAQVAQAGADFFEQQLEGFGFGFGGGGGLR